MISEGVIAPDLSLGYIPDFSGEMTLNSIDKVCDRFQHISSPYFMNRLKEEKGEEALKKVVVYTRKILDPQTGEQVDGEYVVNISPVGSDLEETDLPYVINVTNNFMKLKDDWLNEEYQSKNPLFRESRLLNFKQRLNWELDRLAQSKIVVLEKGEAK